MNNILALDASTKRTGYAFFKDNQIQYGAISCSTAEPKYRIGQMRDAIIELLTKSDIDTVVLEEIRPDGYNNHTSKLLAWLQGCIVIAIYEFDPYIKVEFVGASSWRSKLGIQGYRVKREEQKKKDIEYANNKYNLTLTSSQDDEADAICILTAYLNGAAAPASRPKPIGTEKSAF